MPTVEGVIEEIGIKTGGEGADAWTKYSVKVSGYHRYIGIFDTTIGKSLETGKAYSFEVEEKGKYINLVAKTTPEPVAFPLPEQHQRIAQPHSNDAGEPDRQQSSQRQVALKAAVELAGYIMAHTDRGAMGSQEVMQVAGHFDAWLNGTREGHSGGNGAPEGSDGPER
ncbi:hypothetical protein LCGC14_0819830 [marine sediment metagenome]|uniref:Uncharacterized protein n=1 Tax=marine sediment metagenome TaxID=412755 RepID=A0A0F9PNU9_9ZZZZ